jgi:thermitase
MAIPRRTCLLLALVFVSVFAGWQGVSASLAVSGDSAPAAGVSARLDALLQETPLVKPDNTEDAVSPFDIPRVQSSQNRPDLETQWALVRIQALPSVWGVASGSPVLVAVLDTGIDKDHEDLAGRVVAEIDFSGSSADDVYGHGTPIAGIIAADAANGLGVVGLAPASRLLNVKVAGDDGRCRLAALTEGIIWAVDHGALVINVSIELKDAASSLEDAVDYAWEHGALVVAAAGNDGNSVSVYPAACGNCLAVTAVQESGDLAPLANYGDWVDCAAPGLDIYSTLPGDKYGYKHGTSFATAYVSGLAALLFSMAVDTNGNGYINDEVLRAIESGCETIDIDGTGYGMINVPASVAALGAG